MPLARQVRFVILLFSDVAGHCKVMCRFGEDWRVLLIGSARSQADTGTLLTVPVNPRRACRCLLTRRAYGDYIDKMNGNYQISWHTEMNCD